MTVDDPGNALAGATAALPGGGEERPGQVEMAEAVARAIDGGRHLVVQAGTGTGKSLAYLVPAVLSGRKVVVATATKSLQDQLATKDLPTVAAAGLAVSFAVLKGRSNYLCRQRAAEVDGGAVQQELTTAATASGDATDEDAEDAEDGAEDATGLEDGAGRSPRAGGLVDDVRRLLAWAGRSESGDRAELDFEPHPRAWAMVSVGPRECPGAHRCPQGDACFAERARAAAADADVVVVNTHLYGAHLASGGAVLPPHDVVIFDEAHEVEPVMTQSLGVDVAPGRLQALHALVRPLLAQDDHATTDLADVADRLRATLGGLVGRRVLHARAGARARGEEGAEGGGEDGSVTATAPARGEPAGRERSFFGTGSGAPARDAAARGEPAATGEGTSDLAGLLELAAARTARVRTALGGPADGANSPDGARRARALASASSLASDLARLASPLDGEVAWVDGTGRWPVLRLSPVDVGPSLAATLWGEVTAVLTSATVPPRLAERLGIDGASVDHLDVGSPFDFRSHALLYVARHLPDRRRPEAEAAIFDELAALIEAAGGRTLALFTSRRAMLLGAEAVSPRVAHPVLVQDDLPKGRLLEAFAADEHTSLFATLGFWQGVDVPGRTLSLVTLDRLPFARPGDPVLDARRARAGDAAFSLVDLPRAATFLAQGVGRLIRSAADYGVVAVLDPRLATAGYRKVLLDALPPMRRTVERRDVVEFLARVLGGGRGEGEGEGECAGDGGGRDGAQVPPAGRTPVAPHAP